MIEFDFSRLARIGLTPALLQHIQMNGNGLRGQLLRVSAVHRDTVQLHDGAEIHTARCLPALAADLALDGGLAVGDWVLTRHDSGGLWVQARLPPVTQLWRRDGNGQRQRVASNVDTALLVMGLDGDFNLRRLERFVSMVTAAGLEPVVVLSKADLCADVDEKLAALHQRIPGLPHVFALDSTLPACREVLAPWLGEGQTLVLLGSSGVGKSTLGNTLLGAEVQQTGAVRTDDSRGRHTTTARSLHLCAGGACIIDTPGVRTLQPDLDEDALLGSFADIESLAQNCQFRDCRHQREPGCAVRAGVDADRLDNYFKLLREAQRSNDSAQQRREQQSVWKARSKALRQRQKLEGR